MTATRPKSLVEVAGRVLAGGSFRFELADFLDEFYQSPNAAALAEEPAFLAATCERGPHRDAFLAATAEWLSGKFNLPAGRWILDRRRYLPEPSFAMKTREGRIFLLKDSPGAFKSRNLFVTGNVLERV